MADPATPGAAYSVTAHLDFCVDRNLRPSTIEARRGVLRRLRAFIGRGTILGATRSEIDAWAAALHIRMAPAGRAAELSHACQFFRWARRTGLRTDDPTEHLARPRLQRRLPRPVSDEALARVLAEAPDRVRQFVIFAAFAGLRAGEIAQLHSRDIDHDTRSIFIADGKGGRQRVVPIHPKVLSTVINELPPTGWLFPALRGPRAHVTATNVSTIANTWLRDSAIGGTLHQFRHHFGSRIYAACGDLRVTQELLGHASPKTTAGYVAWSQSSASAAVAALAVPGSS